MPNSGAARSDGSVNLTERFVAGSSLSSRLPRFPEVATGAAVAAGCWPKSGAEVLFATAAAVVATGAAAAAVEDGGCEGGWPPNEKLREELEAAGALLPPAGKRVEGCVAEGS